MARASWLFLVLAVTSCGGRSLRSDEGAVGSGGASSGHSENASGGEKRGAPTGWGGSPSAMSGSGGQVAGGAGATSATGGVGEAGTPTLDQSRAHVEVPHGSYRVVGISADEGDVSFWEETKTVDSVELSVESGVGALAVLDDSGELVGASVTSCVAPRVGVLGRLRVPGEFSTIQAALDAARPFDIVEVAAGTYREHLVARGPVTLLGAGANATFLDGGGEAASILDVSQAHAAVVAGFTFRNAGQKSGCADPDDPGACSGDWYSAAVYLSGEAAIDLPCPPSLLFFHNAVAASHMGLFVNYRARAIATNNVFYGNRYAFVANHHNDAALLANNVFYDNDGVAIFGQASYLSIINNIVLGGGSAFEKLHVQSGFVDCNVVFDSDPGSIQSPIVLDPAFVNAPGKDFRLAPDSPVRGRGCLGGPLNQGSDDPGAYGGPLGNW